MNFSEWLQAEMEARGWDQAELSRRSKITEAQISRVVSGGRNAGVEFCIAIAQALRIPREEVFRARGFLLREPERSISPDADPRAAALAEAASDLAPAERERVLNAWEATLMVAEPSGPYSSRSHARVLDGERPAYEVSEQTKAPAGEVGAEGESDGGSVGERVEVHGSRSPAEELERLLRVVKHRDPELYEILMSADDVDG